PLHQTRTADPIDRASLTPVITGVAPHRQFPAASAALKPPGSRGLTEIHTMKRLPRIEQYGLIGDMQTSAHVCDDGSIDWLCLPRFDSPAPFAALLGSEEHGAWRIAPAAAYQEGAAASAERRYLGESLVLETVWRTFSGSVTVTDFMPPRNGAPQVIRIVE